MLQWPDFKFGPINLWSFPIEATIIWDDKVEIRRGVWNMGGGMEDWAREHKENAPASQHYQKVKPEPIDVIEGWKLSFNLGQVIKYIGRYPYKGQGVTDLEKALWYLEREVNRIKELTLYIPQSEKNISQARMYYSTATVNPVPYKNYKEGEY